jgi:hypothetical protein
MTDDQINESMAKDPAAYRCPCSFTHQPHDQCDGNPDALPWKSLHGLSRRGSLSELLFWRETTDGVQPPVGLHLCSDGDEIVVGCFDGKRWWILDIPASPKSKEYAVESYMNAEVVETRWFDKVSVLWSEWPEGPTTDQDDLLDQSTGMTGDERGMIG